MAFAWLASLAGRMAGALPWLFGYKDVPYLARSTFRYELLSGVFASAAGGVLAPEFAQLFATNSLKVPEQALVWVAAVLTAEIAAGNFLGVFVGQVLQRRRRVPWIVAARWGIALATAAVAALPLSGSSVVPLTALLAVPAILGAIALNVQSSIWHSNYPSQARGRIFGRLTLIRLAVAAGAAKSAGMAIGAWDEAYRIIFLAAAACMVASAFFSARIRVRKERRLLRDGSAQTFHLLAGARLLKQDRQFGQYMLWQMISGGAMLMTGPVIVPSLKKVFDIGYAQGTNSMFLVPFFVQILAVPLAGQLFDKISIMHYRALNSTLWASSRLLLYVGLVTSSWWLVLLSFAVQGLAGASGNVVWNIGHTRFARPGQSQLYMGVHMTLQGIRGLTLPFLGSYLFNRPGVGTHVLAVGVLMQVFAAIEFYTSKPPKPEAALPPASEPFDSSRRRL